MKNVLWFLLLAAVAVVAALLLGDNQAIVSVFWPPWRVDLSLNLVLIGLLLGFVLLHLALRGIALLRALPQRAQRWRQREAIAATRAAPLAQLKHDGVTPREWLKAAREEQNEPILLLKAAE